MSHAPKNNWQPTASIEVLHQRAALLTKVRNFFNNRGVLEVETPLLSHATVTDPHTHSITTDQNYFLQTSPEYAMKRLLAAGSGPIFQITKSFRSGDLGRFHNPEFSMLEWYRPHFDHHLLMDEMDELLQFILNCSSADRLTYAELFEKYLNINPHSASTEELAGLAQQKIDLHTKPTDRNDWLHLLSSHCIEPLIGLERPIFIYDFPAAQASLAKVRHDEKFSVASRFEVYFKGMELANGFHELQNPAEQRKRFENNLIDRQARNYPIVPIDELFLAALESGLPDCSGVALGLDRVIMLALNKASIKEVLCFSYENA